MGTKRRLPVSDAEVLAAYEAGESQRALALRFDVAKGAVQKAIERAKRRSRQPSPQPSPLPGSTSAQGSRPMSDRDIRERLEHEALHASDSRTRLNALKMLHELDTDTDGGKQSKAARGEQSFRESGYYFARGSLVIERRKGRFRAFERTRGGWRDAPVNLDTQEGRVALLVTLVDVFRDAPLQADPASAIRDLLSATDEDGGEPTRNLGEGGAQLALKDAETLTRDEDDDADQELPRGVLLIYPLPKA